ncbi:MAG: sulfatase [Bacteroidota bacterium]
MKSEANSVFSFSVDYKKKLFFWIVIIYGTFLTGCDYLNLSQEETRKPNIIFIVTDDQRWDELGYAGNSIIQTPNMDRIAREGLYFRNAFVTTPICAASRASLLTGLYERTHNYTFGRPNLDDRYMYNSYPYLLRKAGYQTGFVGKFGVKVNEGIVDSLFTSFKTTGFPYLKEIDGNQVHLADINGDLAIDFIRSSKDQPFCLSLSFWSPHADDGEEAQYFWPEYVDSLYRDEEFPLPPTGDPAFFEALPEFLKTSMNRKRWYWRYDTPEKRQQMIKGYYRMISTVDSVIGRIQKALVEEGLSENTVIIFMGDNGYFLGERGYAGKWTLHEHSIRVPMMVYDPRQPELSRGKSFNEMVLNVDITPTILELADADVPESYQGNSLMSFYDQRPSEWRTSVFLEHRLEGNPLLIRTDGIRDDTWKFVRYDDHPEFIELYNHQEDFYETKNLAYESEYSNRVAYYQNLCDSITNELMNQRVK